MYYLVSQPSSSDVVLATVSLDTDSFGNITNTLDLSIWGRDFCGIVVADIGTAYVVGGIIQFLLSQSFPNIPKDIVTM